MTGTATAGALRVLGGRRLEQASTRTSVLAVLLLRERTWQQGSHIDIAMFETLTEPAGQPDVLHTFEGEPAAPRTGPFHPSVVPYGLFRVGDGGMVMMGVQNEREWVKFCAEILSGRRSRTTRVSSATRCAPSIAARSKR